MKLNIKYFLVFAIFLTYGCVEKKEVNITGFAFKGEIIKIYDGNKAVFEMKVNKNRENDLCILYEHFQISQNDQNVKLNIILDSSDIELIDTLLIIPLNNKQPFILFSDPLDTDYKRIVGIHDNMDYYKL